MPDSIHLTVATIVYLNGKFLMVKEMECGEEVVNQPAGHVEAGETLQQAALRETLEETGWHVQLTGFLGITTYRSPRNGITYYRMCFVAEPLRFDEQAELDSDIIAAEWMDYDTLQSSQYQLRSPLVLKAIENYQKGPIYPLSICDEEISNETMIHETVTNKFLDKS